MYRRILFSCKLWFSKVMHVETDLLNCIRDVRVGEREVVKGTSQVAII
jgi:hypothetical protein